MRTRYGVTKPNGRARVLVGRLYDHSSAARAHLDAMLANNSATRLRSVGLEPRTLSVQPFECWDNGDPTGIYAQKDA